MKRALLVFVALMASIAFSFTASAAQKTNAMTVFTSIVPQTYFVKRIGGARVNVHALVTPGRSPATYEPTSRQMAALSEATLFFRIGVPFEQAFIPNIASTHKSLRIIDTRQGIELLEMTAHHHHHDDHESHEKHHDEHEKHHDMHEKHHDEHGKHHGEHDKHHSAHEKHHDDDHEHKHKHEHNAGGHHHEGGKDPHIWLSPKLVKRQALTIADALIAADPAGKATFEKNLSAFIKDLDTLDNALKNALAPVKGKTLMVFHPAWGYFAHAYGLKQESIEVEGKNPSAKRLAEIIEKAKKEDVRVIFVQPQFSMKSARQIARAINGAVVPINPLAENYMSNLQVIAKSVLGALQTQK